MASTEQVSTSENSSSPLYRGVCKWFNNKKGYGFVTIVSDSNKGEDIFVHQSNINPNKSTYRTLCQGEYIQFNLGKSDNGNQAVNVRGIDNGPLMCDNIADRLKQRRSRRSGDSSSTPAVEE